MGVHLVVEEVKLNLLMLKFQMKRLRNSYCILTV